MIIFIQIVFISKTVNGKYSDWQSSLSKCKSEHNSYPLGDVDITNPTEACVLIQGQHQGPSWLGIAKEVYISNDGGNW